MTGSPRMGHKLRVGILGTRGIPAHYGGFETCAEEVSVGLVARGHDVTVYCRRWNAPGDPVEYKWVRLRYRSHFAGKASGTLTHALTCTWDAIRRDFDVLLYFNAATGPVAWLARLTRRTPVVLNVDGLEWKRRKWGPIGRAYYVLAEWATTKVVDRIIADSLTIQRYYVERWGTPSTFVPYGAHLGGPERPEVLGEYGLEPRSYFLVVGRLEPDNNADLIVEAFGRVATDKAVVIVGGAGYRSSIADELPRGAGPAAAFVGSGSPPGHLRALFSRAFAYVPVPAVGGRDPAVPPDHGCVCARL